MKRIFVLSIAFFVCLLPLSAKQKFFRIAGPERSYNQIRVVNETSYGNFKCRLVLLKKRSNGNLTKKGYYGIYKLKGYGDVDTCTNSIRRGDYIGIEMEKNFPCEVEFYVDYKDLPFFDIVFVHLFDGEKKAIAGDLGDADDGFDFSPSSTNNDENGTAESNESKQDTETMSDETGTTGNNNPIKTEI